MSEAVASIARARLGLPWAMPAFTRRPQKITFGEMRDSGVRGLLVYCQKLPGAAIRPRSAQINGLITSVSAISNLFTCKACGRRGGDVRPDFHWNKPPVPAWAIVEVFRPPLMTVP
jgi:hypothetical protein